MFIGGRIFPPSSPYFFFTLIFFGSTKWPSLPYPYDHFTPRGIATKQRLKSEPLCSLEREWAILQSF